MLGFLAHIYYKIFAKFKKCHSTPHPPKKIIAGLAVFWMVQVNEIYIIFILTKSFNIECENNKKLKNLKLKRPKINYKG